MSQTAQKATPILLDLFCKAGGAAMGYHRAGFEIVGVDIEPQPRYPFEFVRADALTFPLEGFDAIHASPPCQAYVDSANKAKHPRLIEPTRERLLNAGVPYVIENVDCAPLFNPLMLCGTMFRLRVIRHRLFESEPPIYFPPADCAHWGKVQNGDFAGVYGRGARGPRYVDEHGRRNRWGKVPEGATLIEFWSEAMGIDWMTRVELTQAVPPAYTEYIGRQLMAVFS